MKKLMIVIAMASGFADDLYFENGTGMNDGVMDEGQLILTVEKGPSFDPNQQEPIYSLQLQEVKDSLTVHIDDFQLN